MALRARRGTGTAGEAQTAPVNQAPAQEGYQAPQQGAPVYQAPAQGAPVYQAPPQEPVYQAPPQGAPVYQAPPQEPAYQQPAYQPPAAPQQGQAPAVRGGNQALVDANAGILDNIDDMNIGGNYVTMDGSNFLYKATDETADTIDAVITYGKRFYQWYDEDNQQYNNSDTKLDDRYKLKFEIRWYEDVDGEPQEHIMSLPTASAMTFINYVKGLSKKGLGVGHVLTRITISRQHNQNLNIRYSRAEFEFAGMAGEAQQ